MNMRAEDTFEPETPIEHKYGIDAIATALERFSQVSEKLWGRGCNFDVHVGDLQDLEVEWVIGSKHLFLNVSLMFGETLRVEGQNLNRSMKMRRNVESDEARELMVWFTA